MGSDSIDSSFFDVASAVANAIAKRPGTRGRRRAKEIAAGLIRDVGFDPVDAGPLRVAQYIEPFTLLVGQLTYEGDGGPALAYRFERFEERS